MRVAMLTSTGDRCGIAAYSRALTAALMDLPETQVVTVPIIEGRQPTQHYVEQGAILNGGEIDVVHIQHEHSFWGGIMPRSSAYWELRYLIKKPVVLTAHTTYSVEDLLRVRTERRPMKLLAKRLLLRNTAYKQSVDTAPFATAYTIVHTTAARNELIQRGVKAAYVTVVPAGVPAATVSPSGGAEFRAKFGLESKRLAVIFGYIAPNKGYEMALDVLASLPTDVILVIAGGARNEAMEPYVSSVRQRIAGSGLKDRVIVTGFIPEDEIPELMAAADLVLTPHTQATGSYSVSLPLSYGKPILASDMDCFKEIQGRVKCMELFQSGNEKEFREKALALLLDNELRGRLGAMARRYAEKTSWPRVAEMTRGVYDSAIRVYSEGHHLH